LVTVACPAEAFPIYATALVSILVEPVADAAGFATCWPMPAQCGAGGVGAV